MHYRIISINNYNNYTYYICLCSMCHDKKNNIVTLYIVVTLLPCFLFYSVPFQCYLHLGFGVRSSFSVWELNWKPHLSYSEGEILAQHNTSWLSIKVITNTNNIYSNGKTKARCQKQSAAQKYLDIVDFVTNIESDLSDLSSTKFTNLHIF